MKMIDLFQSLLPSKKKEEPLSFSGKVEIFSRHCIFSTISQHKKRFSYFTREGCYENLLDTVDFTKANLTFFLDVAKGPKADHFLSEEKICPVIETHAGSEALSFLHLLDYVTQLDLHPETILYFVEDDYIHKPNWISILLEGFQVPGVDYVTLYDHQDKYRDYPKLQSKIFATASSHWRSTPSTTNTFATRFKTLKRDLAIHRKFSERRTISADHDKFVFLEKKRKALLISSIPGSSTHAEPDFASPCIDWEIHFKNRSLYVSS